MNKIIFLFLFSISFINAYGQSQLAGLYKCSSEDIIRLDSDGTGKMIMSYNFDGVRSFTWEYNSQEETIRITSEPPHEQRYEIPPIYLTLYLRDANGRLALEHYTSGPTFLYIRNSPNSGISSTEILESDNSISPENSSNPNYVNNKYAKSVPSSFLGSFIHDGNTIKISKPNNTAGMLELNYNGLKYTGIFVNSVLDPYKFLFIKRMGVMEKRYTTPGKEPEVYIDGILVKDYKEDPIEGVAVFGIGNISGTIDIIDVRIRFADGTRESDEEADKIRFKRVN